MTIAGVYLTCEGVVLGADSTSSIICDSGLHYFDFNQKVFEIGENSTLGLVTWGLGGFNEVSYRTLVAMLADKLVKNPVGSVAEVMDLWVDIVWPAYQSNPWFSRIIELNKLSPHNPSVAPVHYMRTQEEEDEFNNINQSAGVGFCIAGYVESTRKPEFTEIFLTPLQDKPQVELVSTANYQKWWGVPNVIDRLIVGADVNLFNAILGSGHWNGTADELNALIQSQRLSHGVLPIRDAIDYVHSCISSTIKAMKFSSLSQVCGGPIEIAVITTDRKFRWVRHKSFDAAILDGGL
jgi:hypothetical protein